MSFSVTLLFEEAVFMENYPSKVPNRFSRRTFVKGGAVGALALATGASLPAFLVGCEQEGAVAETGTGEPVAGGNLIYALATEVTTLDPHRAGMIVERRVFSSLFDRLFHYGDNGELEPWLATEYQLDEDGKSYILKLQEGVVFHDGTPFNAEALEYNLSRILDPETQANTPSRLLPYTSSDILDEYTIRLNLESPSSLFLTTLSQIEIVSPTAAQASKDQFGTNPVGSGPFIFESWEEDIVVKRNPDYAWGLGVARNKGAAYLDQITFKTVPEESTRVGSVLSDQVHIAETIPPQNYVELENDPSVQVLRRSVEGLAYTLFFVTANEPWSDLKLRQAVVAGIDVKAIIQTIYLGVYDQAFSPLTPGFPFYDDSLDGIDRYDPEKAKRLLDEAGWELKADGIREKDGKRLTLAYGESSPNREKRNDVAYFIQNQLKEIGVEVNVDITTDLVTQLAANAYDLWGNSYASVEPISALQIFYSTFNPYGNPQIDEWVVQAQSELDEEKKKDLIVKTQKEILDQAYIVPIYSFAYTTLAALTVKDFELLFLGLPNYVDVWLQQE
jgi:peptide/nickel transport system substrate-binding protein